MALFFFLGFCSVLLGLVVFIMVVTKFNLIFVIPAALSAAYLAYLAAHSIFAAGRAA
jgi:threonine/homoserine/homoserine lactone efflux protein